MSIFVSIAAYRDPELIPTVQDCLAKAERPDQLSFGICWQHGDDEELPAWLTRDSRFQIIDVDWRESKGVCWARSRLMGLWQGENYFLQIDSHHRFVDGWDTKLIQGAAATESAKPILTTYCPMYTPGQEALSSPVPTQMIFDAFTEDGIATFKPTYIAGWMNLRRPVRARFVSAHFLFAPGSFVAEVPYNPELYFLGEEITLSIRAYTHGYDLYHPSETLLWHEYSRQGRRKHWDDHVDSEPVELPWHQRDSKSKDEVRRFLQDPTAGHFGCGTVRSFAEYTAFAGINFSARKVEDYTRLGGEPPNPAPVDGWEQASRTWNIRIVLKRSQLVPESFDDPHFWYVGVHDSSGTEIYRQDLSAEELALLLADRTEYFAIERNFESSGVPCNWTVWPVTRSACWLDKITGTVQHPMEC